MHQARRTSGKYLHSAARVCGKPVCRRPDGWTYSKRISLYKGAYTVIRKGLAIRRNNRTRYTADEIAIYYRASVKINSREREIWNFFLYYNNATSSHG